MISTFVFRVRNVPAALYKAMGGFATNGVNMTKLESYQLGGTFFATSSTPTSKATRTTFPSSCLEELAFFSVHLRMLGTYPASEFRAQIAEPAQNRQLRPDPPARDPVAARAAAHRYGATSSSERDTAARRGPGPCPAC